MTEAKILLESPQRVLSLFGPRDQYLRTIRDTLGVAVSHREAEIRIAFQPSGIPEVRLPVSAIVRGVDRAGIRPQR